jgi:hypothetical protein
VTASAEIGGQEALMDRADRGLVGQMECDPVGRDRADLVAPAALAQDRADDPAVPGKSRSCSLSFWERNEYLTHGTSFLSKFDETAAMAQPL